MFMCTIAAVNAHNMKLQLLLVGLFLGASWAETIIENALDETVFPANLEKSEALRKFVKLVEAHNLNVTVVLSSSEKWDNGNVKEQIGMAVTFPATGQQTTQTKLTQEELKKFVKVATGDKLAAQVVLHEAGSASVISNKPDAIPDSDSLRRLSCVKHQQNDLEITDPNFAAQYTFISAGADGKNETTKVLWGDAKVEVVEKEGLDENELKQIKRALGLALFQYEEDDIPRATSAILDKGLGGDWQVASVNGENSWVDSKKWGLFNLVGQNYIIFNL